MTDLLSERCGDLLTGSYDCPDRIVLNAYYQMGHAPGGFPHELHASLSRLSPRRAEPGPDE